MKRLTQALGWLWALPLTALGLPFWVWARCLGKPGDATLSAGVFIAHSPIFKRLLKHHPFGQMQAVALGCCVLASHAAALDDCLAHELVHVEQAQRWGMLFPLAYLASSLWQRLNGRCPYADNWFERQANRL